MKRRDCHSTETIREIADGLLIEGTFYYSWQIAEPDNGILFAGPVLEDHIVVITNLEPDPEFSDDWLLENLILGRIVNDYRIKGVKTINPGLGWRVTEMEPA